MLVDGKLALSWNFKTHNLSIILFVFFFSLPSPLPLPSLLHAGCANHLLRPSLWPVTAKGVKGTREGGYKLKWEWWVQVEGGGGVGVVQERARCDACDAAK